jgi:hypothetical protein
MKTEKTKVDLNKAKYAVRAVKPEDCAIICVNDSVYDVANYKCLSFDFCSSPTGGICSFYNASTVTDTGAISLTNGSDCDHYSRVVKNSDGADKETLYRSIQESVARNELDVELVTGEETLVVNFRARDIFKLTGGKDNQGFSGQSNISFINQYYFSPKWL